MPGSEVGDRVHNFFEQSSVLQDQRHNQIVEGNWPGLNNNQWGVNERQCGGPLNSTSKNYNVHQSDVERGQGNQSSIGPHDVNFQQSNLRSEFVKNPTKLQQLNFGGFIQSSQAVHSRQNEANFLGVETDPDRHNNLTSRGLSILESQQRCGSQHTNSASFGGSESPMNFNFFGGQQQMSGQQQRMMQSFPQQHSAISEAQLMQRQVILKQMQEMQGHQQQQQQFEAMQRNEMSQMSNLPNQMGGQHFSTVNGNNQWQSQVMAGNTNWSQPVVSAVQGYSSGVMITPEQGQALRLTGLTPQQYSQSLYGVPVSNSRSPNPLSHRNTDKPEVDQGPASSFSGIQYTSLPEKVDMQDGGTVARSGSEGNTTFEHASSQGFLNVVNPGSFNQTHRRYEQISEGGREDSARGSELLPEKSGTPATSSQAAVGLDPTEEKILFGNDESIWEAFGEPSHAGTGGGSPLDDQDLFNGLPSGQSGRWSALMKSAVAETSSADVVMQEEWSGLDSQNSRPQSGNPYLSVFHENEKQPIWVDSSPRASFSPRTSTNDVNATCYPNTDGLPQLSPKQATKPLQDDVQIPREGMRWLDRSTMRVGSIPASTAKMGSPHVGSVEEGVTRNLSKIKGNTESMELWKSVNSSVNSGNSGSDSDHYNMSKGPYFLESSVVISDGGVARMHEGENDDRRDNSSDSHRSSTPYHAQAGSLRENLWSDTGYSLPVGIEKSSDQSVQKMHATRKFQYHPMGNLDMDLESSYASKHVLHPQSTSLHLSSGVKDQETQPRFFGQLSSNSIDTEGRLSDVHGTVKMSYGATVSGIRPGYFPNASAPLIRSGEISSSNQHGSPSQNMLELLHKVDQSVEQSMAPTGFVGLSQSQSSGSHGFSLQLAPPSPRAAPSNSHFASQISSRSIGSPSLHHTTSDKGDKTKTRAWSTVDADKSAPFSPGSSYLRNSLHNQHITASSGNIVTDQSSAQFFDSHAHHDHQTSDSQDQAAASQSVGNSPNNVSSGRYKNQPFMHPAAMPDVFMKDNISPLGAHWNQQQLWSAQDHSASDLRNSQFPLNGLEAGSLIQPKKDEQDGPRVSYQGAVGGNGPHAKESLSTGKSASESMEESTIGHPSDASPSNSVVSQKDYEESHYSLLSKSGVHHSSSMHPMQAMKSRVSDPTQRESKRLKGPYTPAAQALSDGVDNMFSDASISQTSISSAETGNPTFSPQSAHVNASFQFQHGSVVSHNTPSFGRNDAQKFTAGNGINRAVHAGINPQMAPSWFKHYGQLLTAQNVPIVTVTKNVDPLLISGKSPYNLGIHGTVQQVNAVADTGLIGNTCQTLSSYTPTDHNSRGVVPHVSMPSLPSLRPKKRTTGTFDLLPWNKEIVQGFKRLQNTSSAEIDWARASNRLVEKVERETVPIKDLLPKVRPKRRLILTTQLMQQVLHPPSAAVLSLDASSNFEIIVYSLARLASGDACSLICCTEGDLPVHHNSGNLYGKVNTSDRIRDQYFLKFIEDLSNRWKELESDLVRLDKNASILDLRLDCQDMERFSVINRFAKFHGRAQVDGSQTSSSSSGAPSMAHRPYLQRYVSAHPMPRAIPESVQCLSL